MLHDSPSNAAFAYLSETAPVLMLHLDARQRIADANAHARRVLGDEIPGRPLRDVLVQFAIPVDLDKLIAEGGMHLLSLTTASGMPESFRFRFFPLSEGTLALGSTDFEDYQRLQDGFLALNRELNDLSRQLHQANAELRELNQLKNQFLGMAAHDLRRPVGAIMTYGQFVLDEAGEELTGEHRGFLQTCVDAALDMKRLIDAFLDVSVIESGRLRLEVAPVRLQDIVAPVLELARLAARRKQVELLVELATEDRCLTGDAPKLQQVLLNLIGNAIEHSLPGGRVWLTAAWKAPELVFSVRDEGPGINPEDQRRLFAPFERAGTRKTANERSTGLGLAIARKVVEAHRGRIWVESTPGHGATFSVALPAAEEL
jgi:signal transduction histidine kinase